MTRNFYLVLPPAIPTHSAHCNNVMFEQAPIYVGGRYNKYMRNLPQTAWLVENQRKLETSVHELIGDRVQALTMAQSSKLIASGREDVDVRMLGTGRPFALELTSPRHIVLKDEELKALEDKINSEALGKVAVTQLKVVSKSSMELLKEGEKLKTKTYTAYCVVWDLDKDKLAALHEQLANLPGLAPLTLMQQTPVRVLHRRPAGTRSKTVHWMSISDLKTSENKDTVYFKLSVNTQAGTYIKEFVHGDFGRTKPSLGDLLGGLSVDCLALDVESIVHEWPPP